MKAISRNTTHRQSWNRQAKRTGEALKGWNKSRGSKQTRLKSSSGSWYSRFSRRRVRETKKSGYV